MRPLLAAALSAIILGGLYIYMETRPELTAAAAVAEVAASGRFAVEVTLTFDAGPDPFAWDLSTAPSLLVQWRGQTLLQETDTVPAGQPVRIDMAAEVVEGPNEFFVRATPQDQARLMVRAARVRVIRDQRILAERWLSSEPDVLSDPGAPVEGVVLVDIPTAAEQNGR